MAVIRIRGPLTARHPRAGKESTRHDVPDQH
jgi:hypothetical protein